MQSHKLLCFTLTLLSWAVLAFSATRMTPDASSMAFFPDDAPQIRRMAEALDVSPASNLLFVDLSIDRPDGKYFLADVADAIVNDLPADLAKKMGPVALPPPEGLLTLLPYFVDESALEYLISVADRTHVESAVSTIYGHLGSLLATGPVHDWSMIDPLNFRKFVLSRMPAGYAGAMPDPVLGYPVSADGKHLLLVLRPLHSLHDVSAAANLMTALQESLQKRLQPDMRGLVVGGHRHSAVNAQVIQQDVTKIVIFSMLGFVLVYLFFVRSRGAVWLLLVPCFAASFALGSMTLFTPLLSGLALGFGASVLGIAEDYAVHMHFALRSGNTSSNVLQTITKPLFQGYLINVSGFAVLLFSGLPAIRQLACFAILTLTAGFILAVTILPICPWFSTPSIRVKYQSVPQRQPVLWRVLACGAGMLSLCYALFSIVQVDVSPRTMGADMVQLREDAEYLKTVWGSHESNILVIEGASAEVALSNARAVTERLRQLEPGNTLGTVTDLWPSPEQAKSNAERWQKFTSVHGDGLREMFYEAAVKYGFNPTAFSPFIRLLEKPVVPIDQDKLRAAGLGEMLDVFYHPSKNDREATKILLFTQNKADISQLEPQLRQKTLAMAPGELETTLLQQLDAEKRLLFFAWMICFALLFIYFRDIQQTLLASLPPLCSITCILAWMALSGHSLTLASMAAMPLVLGLAADHGIVVAHELASGQKMGVEKAVLVSSLTALTGMGLLALAQHPALKAMGEVVFWGLLVEVPAALWLLPRLCRARKSSA